MDQAPKTRDAGRSMRDLIESGDRSFSFEFFPPKDAAGEEQLWRAITELEPFAPTFVSVTYGAGGTSRDTTVRIVERIAKETSLLPVAHLTCVGHTTAELDEILQELSAAGVNHVMALRGDPPGGPGSPWTTTESGLDHADDLVAFIKDTIDARVGVAAFPEGHVDAPTLEAASLLQRASAVGVDIPIIPGIMPILNLRSMQRMVEFSRRELPAEVVARLAPYADEPAKLRAEGIALATELCEDLLAAGAPGLHFFTLNFSRATREIFSGLQITV